MSKSRITVAVTGGAIDAGYSFNSSGLIRDALPSTIERSGKPPIDILKYPQGTTCIYEASRALIPRLWSGKRAIYDPSFPADEPVYLDLMLHMGMRSLTAGPVFRLEKVGRRDAYFVVDEAGKYLPRGEGEKGGYWEGLPETLSPGFDVDDVRNAVALEVPDVPIEVSTNAGGYFCEFELYSSLAELHKRGEFKRVEFLHTPAKNGEGDIQDGKRVAMAVICAIVDRLPN